MSATEVFACGCPGSSDEKISDVVQAAAQKSTMVFAGKVVGLEYRKGIPNQEIEVRRKGSDKAIDYETMVVIFQLDRRWKGEAQSEVVLITSVTKYADGTGSSAGCDYSFKKNKSYLVYAYGKAKELRTDACTRTRLLTKAQKDLEILGAGEKPVE